VENEDLLLFRTPEYVVSMLFLSMMLRLRYYYSERSGKKTIEDIDVTLR